MRARVAIAGAVLAGLTAVPALAADPESGTVSMSAPKVTWTGQSVNGGATTIPAVANGGAEACVAPSCDTFALTVADTADLTVIADAPDTGGFTMVQVVTPDGTKIYNSGAENETSTKVKVKKAPKGDYEVQIATNAINPIDYSASAELAVPPPAAPAPQSPAPAPTTAPPPAPAPDPGATLTLRTRTISAKRSRTAPKLVLASDREVTNVRAQLKKGSRTLGKAALARLAKTGTLKFKLRRKLKPGRYVVAVAATDGGRTVGLQAPLTVKR
jgi:hypothetical protein